MKIASSGEASVQQGTADTFQETVWKCWGWSTNSWSKSGGTDSAAGFLPFPLLTADAGEGFAAEISWFCSEWKKCFGQEQNGNECNC